MYKHVLKTCCAVHPQRCLQLFSTSSGIPSIPEVIGLAMMPGQVVLTVKTDSPDGTAIQFVVMFRPITDMEYLAITSPVIIYNSDEGADLPVFLPSGGSFSLYVLSFNSFGSLGTTDFIEVMDVPPGNFLLACGLKHCFTSKTLLLCVHA